MEHWIIEDQGFGGSHYHCSKCGYYWTDLFENREPKNVRWVCPGCKCDMDEESEYVEINKPHCPLCDDHHGCDNCYYGQIDSKELNPHCEDCEHNGNDTPTQWTPLDDTYCRKCGRKL